MSASESAKAFVIEWLNREGKEKQETQSFWIGLLQKVYGVTNAMDIIQFEKEVKIDGHNKYIDAYIPETKVLIEQKSKDINLDDSYEQSGAGNDLSTLFSPKLTPFQQAKRYSDWMPYDERPRWIVVCNFREIRIYDMQQPTMPHETVLLQNLEKEHYRLNFLFDPKHTHIARQKEMGEEAGRIVGKLYDSLRRSYPDPDSEETLTSLNILCVRLVFLLYAEKANLLYSDSYLSDPNKNTTQTGSQFRDYLTDFKPINRRTGLIDLFRILDTPYDQRDPNERKDLLDFAYVNGGLFSETRHKVIIPPITTETSQVLFDECSEGFDWTGISPTVFGAVFESTLDPKTRRKGGMHYTSPENIHRAIDPLFLNDLIAEKDAICCEKSPVVMLSKLYDFQDKIGGLTFLDPACGSGNFLTETYTSLRRLENEVLRRIKVEEKIVGKCRGGALPPPVGVENCCGVIPSISVPQSPCNLHTMRAGAEPRPYNSSLTKEPYSPIKVRLSSFYGIEINDFAVTVAKTALWIAELQMKKETEAILLESANYFPISSYSNIKEANALRVEWDNFMASKTIFDDDDADVIEEEKRNYDYIIGNPPFCGRRYRTDDQKHDVEKMFEYKNIDYVACWYKKAAEIMKGTQTKACFVSTNSITQGEQVSALWKDMELKYKMHITYAYRTFRWDSESSQKAAVHVVIIGFTSSQNQCKKYIWNADKTKTEVSNINGYLIDAPSVFINTRNTPLCDVPQMKNGPSVKSKVASRQLQSRYLE